MKIIGCHADDKLTMIFQKLSLISVCVCVCVCVHVGCNISVLISFQRHIAW